MCYQWSLHLKASALYHESRITQLKVTACKLDNTVNHKIRSFNSEILKLYHLYESTLFFTLLHSSHLNSLEPIFGNSSAKIECIVSNAFIFNIWNIFWIQKLYLNDPANCIMILYYFHYRILLCFNHFPKMRLLSRLFFPTDIFQFSVNFWHYIGGN